MSFKYWFTVSDTLSTHSEICSAGLKWWQPIKTHTANKTHVWVQHMPVGCQVNRDNSLYIISLFVL